MKCIKCGEPLPLGARFCPGCGASVEDVPTPRRLEEPLSPQEAKAVPPIAVAPPPRAARVTPRPPRPLPGVDETPASRGAVPQQTNPEDEAQEHEAEEASTELIENADTPSSDPESIDEKTDDFLTPGKVEEESQEAAQALAKQACDKAQVAAQAAKRVASASASGVKHAGQKTRSVLHNAKQAAGESRFSRPVLIGVVAIVAVLVVVLLVRVSSSLFGTFALPGSSDVSAGVNENEEQNQSVETPASSSDGVAVYSTVEEYSWAELAEISALMTSADDSNAALAIAERHHLCGPDGKLDGTQTKVLTLSDSTKVTMRLAGMLHDERSDGNGRAGLTFIAATSVGNKAMNAQATTAGGWQGSTLRSWVNEGLVGRMPEELAKNIVSVKKVTNAVAGTQGGQVTTDDQVWAPSYSEVVGALSVGSKRYEAYKPEGEQYQVFKNTRVRWDEPNSLLAINEFWWTRTPDPLNSTWFLCVQPDGSPTYAHLPATPDAVIIGFCL